MPTSAPLSSQRQIFDGPDYRYRPDKLLNGTKARTSYQLDPEPTSPDQKHIWNVRRRAVVSTSLDGSTSSWLSSLPEADTQDWSNFTLKTPKQIYSVTTQYKAQAAAQNAQLNTHGSISF